MATRQTSVKIPHNPRVVRARGGKRIAHDTVSPSVRGIRTVAPGVIGIQDRKYFQRIMKVAQAAGDALAICQKLKATGDASSIDTVTALTQLLSSIIDQLRAEVDAVIAKSGAKDSILREQNAQQNTDDPTQAALIGQDAAIRHARFSVAQDNAESLGAVNPARIAAGLPDDVPEDVYEHMKNLSK